MAHIEQMGVNIADTIEEGYQTVKGAIAAKGRQIEETSGELGVLSAAIQSRVDAFSGELLTALQADNLLVVGGVERAQQSLAHLGAAIKQQVEEACLGAAGKVAQSTALLRSLMSDSLQAKRRLEAKVMAEMSSWNEANRMYMATIRSLQETLQADYALKCKSGSGVFVLLLTLSIYNHRCPAEGDAGGAGPCEGSHQSDSGADGHPPRLGD